MSEHDTETETPPTPASDVTPPRPVHSATEIRDALTEARQQQIESLADLTRVHTDLIEEVRQLRDAMEESAAGMEASAARHQERAEHLAQRVEELEARLRVQPTVEPPEAPPTSALTRHGRKRPSWL